MREINGNLWDFLGMGRLVITTNGYVTREGRAILGQGVARQAGNLFPRLSLDLGAAILAGGNHVHDLGGSLVSFPVEDSPWSFPDLHLVRRSAHELRAMADHCGWPTVIMPRPGCGGGLDWKDVAPVLRSTFDERFVVITPLSQPDGTLPGSKGIQGGGP